MKYLLRTVLVLAIFLGMGCDCEGYLDNPEYISCKLTDVQLHNMNNEGKQPVEAASAGVKKEAYVLRIDLITDSLPSTSNYGFYKLEDGITKLNINTVNILNQDYPVGADVTTCFKNYPRSTEQQILDSTQKGDTIDVMYGSKIYLALLTIPQAGSHSFRVTLTLASGRKIERETTPVILN
ncbi:DUF5034 domain-containing protein [uncultured Bacteroides sp.]|uniref:DUF5034 domain-containing protein n=1 Tax=uncultured Bacteroides sp. TaxID=162156 RepID=UPI002AAA85B7|nr:DUF5034 domain-containing protein [uncultured Bacteroides sp.]